jgi:hypothetical protein
LSVFKEIMKIIKNEKLIKRNTKIGQYTNLAGIVLLAASMYLGFTSLNKVPSQGETYLLFGAVILAVILTQVSMYFGTRWGRRPDEAIDKALKGLPGDYTLYHDSSPVPHLIVGPAGVWLILPYHMRGNVTYRKNRWRVGGGGFAQSYLRLFGQESVGRPDLEVGSQAASLEKLLRKKFDAGEQMPPISAALVFLDEQVEVNAEGAPLPTMQVKKLRDVLRKAAKEQPFPATDLERVKAALAKD